MEIYYSFRRWFDRTWLGKFWYWLRCHTINRYHVVNFASPENNYTYGWMDRCEAILYSSFALLVECVEKENLFTHFNWECCEEVVKEKAELQELYNWWKKGRRDEENRVSALFAKISEEVPEDEFVPAADGFIEWITHTSEHPLYEEWKSAHDGLEKKDNEMLMRLVKIRNRLWT